LTIAIDEHVLRRARMRALQQGTSVNALLREYLEAFAGAETSRAVRKRLGALARRSNASSEAKRVTRDELHDRSSP
jgi:hypothetical protein